MGCRLQGSSSSVSRVFASPGSLTERLADLGLPDYEQYEDLVRILCRTRHSVVILTGDVHFGRVARCSLRRARS